MIFLRPNYTVFNHFWLTLPEPKVYFWLENRRTIQLGCRNEIRPWLFKLSLKGWSWNPKVGKAGNTTGVEAYAGGSSLFRWLQILWMWLEHGAFGENQQKWRQNKEAGVSSWRAAASRGLPSLTGVRIYCIFTYWKSTMQLLDVLKWSHTERHFETTMMNSSGNEECVRGIRRAGRARGL